MNLDGLEECGGVCVGQGTASGANSKGKHHVLHLMTFRMSHYSSCYDDYKPRYQGGRGFEPLQRGGGSKCFGLFPLEESNAYF